MRITHKMVMNNQTKLLGKNLNLASKAARQVSSGKKYEKLSENPLGITRAIALRNSMSTIDSYSTNLNDAISENTVAESAILEINTALQQVRETVFIANHTTSDIGYEGARIEVEAMLNSIVDNLNTSYNGNYVFGGTLSGEKPFSIMDDANGIPTIVNNGNDDNIQIEIADGVKIDKNVKGGGLISYDNGVNTISTTLNKIMVDFANEDNSNETANLAELKEHESNLLTNLTKVGSRTKRYEDMLETQSNIKFSFLERVSKIEDADVEEAFTEYSSYKMAYEASVAAVQQLSQLNLLSILR